MKRNDIRARNVPLWVRLELERAKGDDAWLALFLEGAKARGIDIDYEPLGIGRPTSDEVEKNYEAYLKKCQADQREVIRREMIQKTKDIEKRLSAEG
jgi:hypothetical protein